MFWKTRTLVDILFFLATNALSLLYVKCGNILTDVKTHILTVWDDSLTQCEEMWNEFISIDPITLVYT